MQIKYHSIYFVKKPTTNRKKNIRDTHKARETKRERESDIDMNDARRHTSPDTHK